MALATPLMRDARILLAGSLPRVAVESERIIAWLDGIAADHPFSLTELAALPAGEGLAALAALDLERRQPILDQMALSGEKRRRIETVLEHMPGQKESAILVQAFSYAAQCGRLLSQPDLLQREDATISPAEVSDDSRITGIEEIPEEIRKILDSGQLDDIEQLRIRHPDPEHMASLAVAAVWKYKHHWQKKELSQAMEWMRKAEAIFSAVGVEKELAEIRDSMVWLLHVRGDLHEAIRILREKQLPAYERLGDERSRAVTLGNIAYFIWKLGELDEALRICREEQLPVVECLGDMQLRALALGQVADILRARGELDEALRIHREEQLPVFERLGDLFNLAHTRYSIAILLYEQNGLTPESTPLILDHLNTAFALSVQQQRPEAVSAIGFLLGQVLKATENKQEAIAVLEQVATAARQIGLQVAIENCDTLLGQLKNTEKIPA
ncbi:MAG: hypothetical protein HQL65_08640 [Magnetococcales bacterium]|nr:hypothetical protein [Magnetococcales bacterium]